MPIPAVTQCATQRGHMDREVRRLDENIGPDPSHQILLADQLSTAFEQGDQDFQSATSERHRLVAFPQKELRREQAERSERDFSRSGAGRSNSLLEEWLVCIRILNGGSRVDYRFGLELRQASKSCSRS